MQRDDAYIRDILDAAITVLEFSRNVDEEAFYSDRKTQAAVLYELLIVGEATKRLSASFRMAHPEVSWQRMAGMRDVLIHDYDDVDQSAVWQTLREEVPNLIAALQAIVSVVNTSEDDIE